jgi:hypothetical protein
MTHKVVLQASLCEIERGLYCATYSIRPVNAVGLPMFQLAKSAAEAKDRIEKTVRDQGYKMVIWTDALVPPGASTTSRRETNR